MITEFFEIALVFFLSTFKFFGGLLTSLALQQGMLWSFISTLGGGVLGVIAFVWFGDLLKKTFNKFYQKKQQKVTKWSRFLVKFRKNFGLLGIALVTPIVSIPIGVMLAYSITSDKFRISSYIIVSLILWTTAIFVPYYLLGLNLQSIFKSLF